MAYTINKTDGTILATVNDGVLDTTSSMSLIGRNYQSYGEAFNEKRCGYFLDIGAHDGVVFSNTYLLETKYNWSGILIEANPISFRKLNSNRIALCLNVVLDRAEGEVDFALKGYMGRIIENDVNDKGSKKSSSNQIKLKTKSLNYILKKYRAPDIIDYLSIDVEGAEEKILKEFNFQKYIFRCITIERPTNLLRKLLPNRQGKSKSASNLILTFHEE